MQLELSTFLIVCPLVFLAGFVDSIAGGGGLISLPAYLIAGLPSHYAIGTNKISAVMGTTVATAKYAQNGCIPWKQAPFCAIFALIGSTLGAKLALCVNDRSFKILMLVILPLTAAYLFLGKGLKAEKEPFSSRKTLIISLPIAFLIGIYDGFYGPGTGTFLLLLLTGLAHMKLREAGGIAKVINLSTNVAAVCVYLRNGKTLLLLGLIAGCFSIVGNYLGAKQFVQKGAKTVKPLMVFILVIFFIKVLWELIHP